MDYGLAWGTDGKFGHGVDVYFHLNDEGVLDHVEAIMLDAPSVIGDMVNSTDVDVEEGDSVGVQAARDMDGGW